MDYTEHLRLWVEQQKASGTGKERLKQLLSSNGHPASSLVVVDEVYAAGESPEGRHLPKKVIVAAIVIAALAILLVAAFFLMPRMSGSGDNEVYLAEGRTLAEALAAEAQSGRSVLESIKPEYVPQSVAIEAHDAEGEASKSARWSIGNASFMATAISAVNAKAGSVFVSAEIAGIDGLSSTSASALLQQYFIVPPRDYSCYKTQATGITICDYYSTRSRSGSGATFNSETKAAVLFMCEFSEESGKGKSSCVE